jgi:hypothetical protein
MPDLMTILITFVIAVIAALVVAWLVGHFEPLAKFVGIEQE